MNSSKRNITGVDLLVVLDNLVNSDVLKEKGICSGKTITYKKNYLDKYLWGTYISTLKLSFLHFVCS